MSDDVAHPPGGPPAFAPPPDPPPPFAQPPHQMPASPSQDAVPTAAELPLAPAELFARARHPVLGASLWIFGAVLWAYVVMGEWVLRFDLPEMVGALVVLGAYGVAWISSVRDRTAPADPWRLWLPGGVGLGLFLGTLLITLVFSSPRPSTQAAITVLLWFFSAACYIAGRSITARRRTARTRARTAVMVVVWLLSGLATLIFMASTLSHA